MFDSIRSMSIVMQVITVTPVCIFAYWIGLFIYHVVFSMVVYIRRGPDGWQKWHEGKFAELAEREEKKRRK